MGRRFMAGVMKMAVFSLALAVVLPVACAHTALVRPQTNYESAFLAETNRAETEMKVQMPFLARSKRVKATAKKTTATTSVLPTTPADCKKAKDKEKGFPRRKEKTLTDMIEKGVLSENCVATEKAEAAILQMYTYESASAHPSWTVLQDCRDGGKSWWENLKGPKGKTPVIKCKSTRAHVSCPCSSGKSKMSESEALRNILGQLGSMESGAASAELTKRLDRMKTGLASVKMLQCWQKACSKVMHSSASTAMLARAGRARHAPVLEEDLVETPKQELSAEQELSAFVEQPNAAPATFQQLSWNCA